MTQFLHRVIGYFRNSISGEAIRLRITISRNDKGQVEWVIESEKGRIDGYKTKLHARVEAEMLAEKLNDEYDRPVKIEEKDRDGYKRADNSNTVAV